MDTDCPLIAQLTFEFLRDYQDTVLSWPATSFNLHDILGYFWMWCYVQVTIIRIKPRRLEE